MDEIVIPFENDAEFLDMVNEHYANDNFAFKQCGIKINAATPGQSFLSMELDTHLANADGGVHGGAIYAFADFAAAVADCDKYERNMTVDGSIQYLGLARGFNLYAHATRIKRGSTIAFYNVSIYDDVDTPVANAVFTFMHHPA